MNPNPIKVNKKYPWAANLIKLERAINSVSNGSEEEIKAKYISFGGLIRTFKEKVKEQPKNPRIDVALKEDEELMTADAINNMLEDEATPEVARAEATTRTEVDAAPEIEEDEDDE